MTTYIALLRGINVGGRQSVSMADLRATASALGLAQPRTLLQSGNLVFECVERATSSLERALEEATAARLGLDIAYFVRSAEEWSAIVTGNPFSAEAARDPGRLVVMLLKAAPRPGAVDALRAAITGRETVQVEGRHAYVVYPDGQGRSRLTNALVERVLGTRGTARNWNTVTKLLAQSPAPA